MRVTPALTVVVVLLAALAGTVLATTLALLWPERYVTRPGWPTYYLGISPLIRQAPVADALARPTYAGALGTRERAAQSEVTLPVAIGQSERAWQTWHAYLRASGFVQMRTPSSEPAGQLWRSETYLAPRGGGVVQMTLEPMQDEGGEGATVNLLHLR